MSETRERPVAIVTGATSGIGRQVAVDLARYGLTVAVTGRDPQRLKEVLEATRRHAPDSTAHACDVRDFAQVQAAAAAILRRHGRVEVLVNNAGYGRYRTVEEMEPAEFADIMSTNYLGVVHWTKAILPSMVAQRVGHIVNVTSLASRLSIPRMAAYCASKHAVLGFSTSLWYEVKRQGLHVSVISPGPIRTQFGKSFEGRRPRYVPLVRWRSPEIVSRAVVRALETGRFAITVPRVFSVFVAASIVLPRLWRWAVWRFAMFVFDFEEEQPAEPRVRRFGSAGTRRREG